MALDFMHFVKKDMKIKLVIKLGPVMIIFATRADGISDICPILKLIAEVATIDIITEYARMDMP